jgi:hypothetical protein
MTDSSYRSGKETDSCQSFIHCNHDHKHASGSGVEAIPKQKQIPSAELLPALLSCYPLCAFTMQ